LGWVRGDVKAGEEKEFSRESKTFELDGNESIAMAGTDEKGKYRSFES